MNKIILENIDISFDLDAIAAPAHIRKGSSLYRKMETAIPNAQQTVKPKAVVKICNVDSVQNGITSINGVDIKSSSISEKLHAGDKIFLYVVTAGDAPGDIDDAIDGYIMYVLESAALAQGCQAVKKHLQGEYRYKEMGFFEPGSLPDWPIENNKVIFEMIGTVTQDIGVSLKSSHFMKPNNTLSGIMFAADK